MRGFIGNSEVSAIHGPTTIESDSAIKKEEEC